MLFIRLLVMGMLAGGSMRAVAAVDFARDVEPILRMHCWGCHGDKKQESGLRLDQRGSMLRGGDYGRATLTPGEKDASFLIDVINHRDQEFKMPLDKEKLSEKKIAVLTQWVQEGAAWPGQMDQTAQVELDHWAFVKVQRPRVPASGAVTNPVDAFLLAKLKQAGLGFSKPAGARSLIRRASIVLTGLAPTPERVRRFEKAYAANRDTAYAALVDELLSSEHFGARWAQHWLDVIRWGETNGSESNLYRVNAWAYRDYVVNAFNTDKPYDQFVREQLAGDTMEAGEATGFLVAGPHVPAATVGFEGAAIRQARADRMNEIVTTVGASMLGVNMACARCHNHKFDPITMTDYYAMSAVFAGVEFGGRTPELKTEHPRRVRGEELWKLIERQRGVLASANGVGNWEEDWGGYRELHFKPIKTQRVRVSFMWPNVSVDELEIFGPGNPNENFARASLGTRVSSPEMFNKNPRAKLRFINDGDYGTMRWGGAAPKGGKDKPWVEFAFEAPRVINKMRMSSNREYYFEVDYLSVPNKMNFGSYRVEVLTDNDKWVEVGSTIKSANKIASQPRLKKAMDELVAQIGLLSAEGPQHSFVGRFVDPPSTHVMHRGSPENLRDEVVAPAGVAVFNGNLSLKSNAPGAQRRVKFANWVADAANPLTSRVMVNRIWHHVFGAGLVTTTSDFGVAGARPSHAELLDWLAAELAEPTAPTGQPWSMKSMIRLLVMSKAFRQSSLPHAKAVAVDVDSKLLWRFPPRRMEAEVIRDAVLRASGKLDLTVGGIGYRIHNVKKTYSQWKVVDNHGPTTWRRMLYQERMRRVDDQMFSAFDFPDCGQLRGKRPVSTTPLQALNLLNSAFVVEQAQMIADRAARETNGQDASNRIKRCFQLVLNREPNQAELTDCLAVVNASGLHSVCRALINSNEFSFLP